MYVGTGWYGLCMLVQGGMGCVCWYGVVSVVYVSTGWYGLRMLV